MNDERLHLLDYLPAIYRETTGLEGFLRPFETRLHIFEFVLDHIACYFAPEHTRAEFLPWLASWVALTLEEDWSDDERRSMIARAVELYRWRGTVRGLKEYIEIFTKDKYDIVIHDPAWPAGMQIGVTSRIGWLDELEPGAPNPCPTGGPESFDWYVVTEAGPEGSPEHFYRADRVERIEILESNDDASPDTISFFLRPQDGEGNQKPKPIEYTYREVERRDGVVELCQMQEAAGSQYIYRGSTALISQIEWPHRFIVELHENGTPDPDKDRTLEKVRNIIDQEKPAHTFYHLRTISRPAAQSEPLQKATPKRPSPITAVGHSRIGVESRPGQ